jgi:uncharacterized protein
MDVARAGDLYKRACELGAVRACSGLGFLMERGLGVPMDRKRALELYEQACNKKDPTGCNNLAVAFHNGDGRAVDLERAQELYTTSCEQDYPQACVNLGRLFRDGQGVARDPGKAEHYFLKACKSPTEIGRLSGCVALAERVVDNESSAIELVSAVEYATRACDGGDRNGCLVLGKYYWKRNPDLAKARKLFQQACDLGSKGGCAGVKHLGAEP